MLRASSRRDTPPARPPAYGSCGACANNYVERLGGGATLTAAATRQPQESSATLVLSKSTASVAPPINPWACPRDQPPTRAQPPSTHPSHTRELRRHAKDRTPVERWAGLHERSQGGPLASACENRKSSLRRHRGAISTQGGTCDTTQRRQRRRRDETTSRRPTKSPRRQRSHPRARHHVSLPNAPSNSAAAEPPRSADAAGRVASHPHSTVRPPTPPLGTARGRSCRRVDEDPGKKMSPSDTR